LVQTMRTTSTHHLGILDMADDLETITDALSKGDADPWQAGFNPSPSRCKYCQARTACPRLQYDVDAVIPTAAKPLEIIHAAETPRLPALLIAFENAEHIRKAAEAELTRRLEAGETDSHFAMVPGRSMRKVTRPAELVSRMVSQGVPLAAALTKMSLSVGDAEDLLSLATGLRGKQLAERLAAVADDCIERTTPEMKLGRVKNLTN